MGIITIKPFGGGALLTGRDMRKSDANYGLSGAPPVAAPQTGRDPQKADAGLARDMVAFVLENEQVDICTCGVYTLGQVREDFSASWTKLTPERRTRLGLAAATTCPSYGWLEEGWRHA
jgi:aryl-alcohol dehydrogenase-like predicted oxidoreductase